jgi:hypothetical protein
VRRRSIPAGKSARSSGGRSRSTDAHIVSLQPERRSQLLETLIDDIQANIAFVLHDHEQNSNFVREPREGLCGQEAITITWLAKGQPLSCVRIVRIVTGSALGSLAYVIVRQCFNFEVLLRWGRHC